MTVTIRQGDCRDVLATLPDESVHCVVTSPPYFGLRDYGTATWQGGDPLHSHDRVPARGGRGGSGSPGKQTEGSFPSDFPADKCSCGAIRVDGQIGLEPTPDAFVAEMVNVFASLRRVLRSDGTAWLNLGDSYAGSGRGGGAEGSKQQTNAGSLVIPTNRGSTLAAGLHETARQSGAIGRAWVKPPSGLKQKDLIGIPWRVAFALQADGWYLRQDIIWSKPNPMPESVRDRCTKAHEYLFLLSKSERYYFDQDAIREQFVGKALTDLDGGAQRNRDGSKANEGRNFNPSWKGSTFDGPRDLAVRPDTGRNRSSYRPGSASNMNDGEHVAKSDAGLPVNPAGRNKRSVWEVTTSPFGEAHFATFPPALIEPCILAGCPKGGTVLDPFFGAGTTGLVADRLGRNCIGIELNPEYAAMAERRIKGDAGMFAEVQM